VTNENDLSPTLFSLSKQKKYFRSNEDGAKVTQTVGALISVAALMFCPFGSIYAQDNQAT
jgi:hypothetical protein